MVGSGRVGMKKLLEEVVVAKQRIKT